MWRIWSKKDGKQPVCTHRGSLGWQTRDRTANTQSKLLWTMDIGSRGSATAVTPKNLQLPLRTLFIDNGLLVYNTDATARSLSDGSRRFFTGFIFDFVLLRRQTRRGVRSCPSAHSHWPWQIGHARAIWWLFSCSHFRSILMSIKYCF